MDLLLPVGIVGVSLFVLWTQPVVGILATVAAQSFAIHPEAPNAVRLLKIPYLIGVALLVPLAIQVIRDRRIRVLEEPTVRILVGIVLVYSLSTAWNELRGITVLSIGSDKTKWLFGAYVARLAFVVLFVSFVTTQKRIEAVIVASVLLTVAGAMESIQHLGIGSRPVVRAAGDFGYAANSNRLAFVCVFATSFVWFFRDLGPRHWWRPVTLPLLFVLPAAALAAGSRSGVLQGLAVSLLALRGSGSATRGHRVLVIGVLAALLAVAVAVTPSGNLERATTFDVNAESVGQKSLQSRVYQIENALGLFAAHPLLGIGVGNFEAVTMPLNEMGRGVHNSYLRALVEGGLGVLLLYLALFATMWRELGRQLETAGPDVIWIVHGLRGALVAFLIFSIGADAWHQDHLYLLVGLTIATGRLCSAQRRMVLEVVPTPLPRAA